ncbi:MAG: 3-hydroxyacyl-CoA dehydrogenase family protein [Deltaproteobacteria bacterium]|nr:3-hydroxyacyl-CoA dehydrogenase family protein [Deltaproteobacteria bacterium]
MKKCTDINKVAIVGAGLMGYGIGVDFARTGYETWMYNTREETSHTAMERAREALSLFVEADMMSAAEADAAYAHLHPTIHLEQAVENADYVSESALESLSLKRQIFADLDRLCPASAILTTNSSNFTTTSIVKENRMDHPERCCVAHYFQPPHLLPLVEVVGGEETAQATLDKTCEILSGMQKKPVVIPVEVRGHAGNRIQSAIGREIRYLVDNKICTPEMIDDIIMYGFGRRMANTGWFVRNDLIGLDFTYNAAKSAGAEPWEPFKERVERGDLGMKSGKGFYEWPDCGKAINRKQNTDLLRYLKRDIEEGKL